MCGTHFIRAMVLEKGVLKFLQILLWYISDCEDLFREKLGAKRKEEFKKELAAKRRQLTQAQRRIEELDRLFKRIYEDNISGKINDSRFQKLSADYEKEQAELIQLWRVKWHQPDMPFLILELLPESGNSAVCRKEEKFVQIA